MLLPCFSEEEAENQRDELTCLTQPISCGLVSNFTFYLRKPLPAAQSILASGAGGGADPGYFEWWAP